MSSVRIESDAFGDARYERLAREAGLADADHARGKMALLWRQCTIECTHELSVEDVNQVLGERGVEALIAARLGEKTDTGVRIRGTKGRIEWLEKLRKNGRKGGRPKKTKWKPSGFQEPNPLALALAPSLAQEQIPDSAREASVGEAVGPKPKRKSPLVAISDDWHPTASHVAKAVSAGLDVHREAERFRNHAIQNDRKCASWNHAFANWLLEAEDRLKRQPKLVLAPTPQAFNPRATSKKL